MQTVRAVASEVLPAGYGFEWSGASYQEVKAGSQAPLVLGFGLIVVFLVLAAQYERWSLPLAVLLAVPIAVLGALIAIWLRGQAQDIYFQIGLLTRWAGRKNAILIVEFSVSAPGGQGHRGSASGGEAAVQAHRDDFTGFHPGRGAAGVLNGRGGVGAAFDRDGVVGDAGGDVLAVFFVPVFFVLIQRAEGSGVPRGRG
jgi:hypothetical protein